MKYLLLLLLFSCTQKYQTYHVIDKNNFNKDNYVAPISPKMYPARKAKMSHCEGQIFWSSNAKKKTDLYIERMVRTMCPDKNYILNSRLTETWWTTIVYSKSCVEFEYYCPK